MYYSIEAAAYSAVMLIQLGTFVDPLLQVVII